MTNSYKKKLFAITTALSITALLFLSNNAYAESTVKNKIQINGVEYINEEIKTDGSVKTDIDVSVKNNQGSIKYNVNGEEKNIQISPRANTSDKETNESSDIESKITSTHSDDSEKLLLDVDDKKEKKAKKTRNLIEVMMQSMDKLFLSIRDFFN